MRWLLNKLRDRVKHLFAEKRLVVYLDQFATAREMVMAEDLYFGALDSEQAKTHWQSFRILHHPNGARRLLTRAVPRVWSTSLPTVVDQSKSRRLNIARNRQAVGCVC